MQVPLAVLALTLTVAMLPGDPKKKRARSASFRSVMSRSLIPNLFVNLLVATVMMTTLVIGPFYLRLGLNLKAMPVGFVMAAGPMISILSGIPSGRLVDSWGSGRVLTIGLVLLTTGAFLLATLPNVIGVTGYLLSIVVLTPGYQLFQAANNTAALANVPKDRRGLVSGLLGLSRNIGLILGASVMGAVFAFGVGTEEFAQVPATAIAAGMRLTFLLAAGLMIAAMGIAFQASYAAKRSL